MKIKLTRFLTILQKSKRNLRSYSEEAHLPSSRKFQKGWRYFENRWKVFPLNKTIWPIQNKTLWKGEKEAGWCYGKNGVLVINILLTCT